MEKESKKQVLKYKTPKNLSNNKIPDNDDDIILEL
jgi:hypothetical protein